jgi:hypothetical protein
MQALRWPVPGQLLLIDCIHRTRAIKSEQGHVAAALEEHQVLFLRHFVFFTSFFLF